MVVLSDYTRSKITQMLKTFVDFSECDQDACFDKNGNATDICIRDAMRKIIDYNQTVTYEYFRNELKKYGVIISASTLEMI